MNLQRNASRHAFREKSCDIEKRNLSIFGRREEKNIQEKLQFEEGGSSPRRPEFQVC
jgi:hypothetical protein